jgi:probable HAF family extracellular repeat protein
MGNITMIKRIQNILLVIGCLSVSVTSVMAQADQPPPRYLATDIGALDNGQRTTAMDMNERGQIVGISTGAAGSPSEPGAAFIWESGKMTSLGVLPNYYWSVATSINDLGQVVGYCGDTRSKYKAFIWDKISGMQPTGNAQKESSAALKITNSGLILINYDPLNSFYGSLWVYQRGDNLDSEKNVGTVYDNNYSMNNDGALIYSFLTGGNVGGSATILSKYPHWLPEVIDPHSKIINNYSDILEVYATTSRIKKSDNTILDIGQLNGNSMNDLDDVIGYTASDTLSIGIYVNKNKKKYDLTSLISNSSSITSFSLWSNANLKKINNRGDITGTYNPGTSVNGGIRSFILQRDDNGDGTPDSMLDTDGDGIPDDWEENGYDVFVDGQKVHVDLKAMGANKLHKDIFVYMDHLATDNPTGANHSHQISKAAQDFVVRAFLNAPVKNPDSIGGIDLHLKNGKQIIETKEGLGFQVNGYYNWDGFDDSKRTSFPKELAPVFHYCISGHYGPYTETKSRKIFNTGISRNIPASDFLITLGPGIPVTMAEAGTFMHELGHNLGLGHGGPILNDLAQIYVNHKPNHLSVMNYLYQRSGISDIKEKAIDYSRYVTLIDESQLFESKGLLDQDPNLDIGKFQQLRLLRKFPGLIGISPNLYGSVSLIAVDGGIDWDWNLIISTQSIFARLDDYLPTKSADYRILKSANEWDQLIYDGGLIGIANSAPAFVNSDVITGSYLNDSTYIDTIEPPLQDYIPATPLGINLRVASRTARLAWNPVTLFGSVKYKVYRKIGNGSFVEIATANNPLYNDSSLVIGSSVSYYIKTLGENSILSGASLTVSGVIR